MIYEYIKNGSVEFRGYQFHAKQPVDVTDEGTLSILAKDPAFRRVINEKVEEASTPQEKVLEPCPFCNKRFTKQGPRTMHVRACGKQR
jgi:hypothetical protein